MKKLTTAIKEIVPGLSVRVVCTTIASWLASFSVPSLVSPGLFLVLQRSVLISFLVAEAPGPVPLKVPSRVCSLMVGGIDQREDGKKGQL